MPITRPIRSARSRIALGSGRWEGSRSSTIGPGPSAGDVDEEPGRPLDGVPRQRGVDAALEPMGGIGAEAVVPRLAHEVDGAEPRALEEYVPSRFRHRGVEPAHDPGERDRAPVVGDDEGGRTEVDLAFVEEREAFPRAGAPYPDASLQPVEVEGMEGLPELQHDVVRHIDDRRHGPHPASSQTFAHPEGSHRGGVEAPHHPADVAGAAFRGFQRNGKAIIDRGRHRIRRRPAGGKPVDRPDLARDPGDREAIAAIRGQAQLEDGVVKPQKLEDIRPRGRVRIELDDPVVLVAESELAHREQHSLRRRPPDLGAPDLDAARDPGAGAGRAPPASRPGHWERRTPPRPVRRTRDRQRRASTGPRWDAAGSPALPRPPRRRIRRGRRRAPRSPPRGLPA